MNPVTHFLASWTLASAFPLSRRDRVLVTWSGVVPDLDGLGIAMDFITRNTARPTDWWSLHHVLGHNLGLGVLVFLGVLALAKRRLLSACLAFGAFHIHLLCDILGARGPDGDQWPIPYLQPFSPSWSLTWDSQWALNAWPNFVFTAALLAWVVFWSQRVNATPVECFSQILDRKVVAALGGWIGRK